MSMFKNKLGSRLALSKSLWFVFWLVGFFSIPYFVETSDLFFRIWILFWYTTLGVFVGLMWIMDKHPVLNCSMPFWIRWLLIWAWLNVVLVFFTYDQLTMFIEGTMFAGYSPFWFALEWAILWLIIDFFATKYVWEWKELLK